MACVAGDMPGARAYAECYINDTDMPPRVESSVIPGAAYEYKKG